MHTRFQPPPRFVMTVLTELPTELILHIVSFLTRERILDLGRRPPEPELVSEESDLPSINALSRTNTILYPTLNQALYKLCASDPMLGLLAIIFCVEHELESALDKLVTAGISVNTEVYINYVRFSLLHIAANRGLRVMVVKLLEMYGEEMAARVHARRDRRTALDYAARRGDMDIVRILAPISMPSAVLDLNDAVVPGPDPDSDELETREQYLSRALLSATQAGNLEVSQYLISEGAEINFLDKHFFGPTPLFNAAGGNSLELVQLLLASGADPNLRDNCERVAIFAATSIDVVQALVAAGANIHAEDNESRTVLMLVGDVELLRFFLERGVDPNHQDTVGRTPLHFACQRRNSKAQIELLLQFGATVELKANGHTPVEFAMRRPNLEAVKILEPLIRDPDLKREIAKWLGKRERPKND